jgi:pimeloyl-ACP methyl ester carboxylesterase
MRFQSYSMALLALACSTAAAATPYEFRAMDGSVVAAELGEVTVPENRNKPNSRRLKLRYVHFASTSKTPGSPIIYLAGGPGGPGIGTARYERFPMFMALREVADVVAFDQRGTGMSNDIPACDSGVRIPLDAPMSREVLEHTYRQAAVVCRRFWDERGVDLDGYTTVENAADLDALRAHLGADKITLWGISYGSHVAFAALKQMESRIDKVVLASGEGLHQTIKMPVHTDSFFRRFNSVLRRSAPAAADLDVPAMMKRVHARLEKNPASVLVKNKIGETATMVFGKYDAQFLSATGITDPANTLQLIKAYQEMDAGNFTPTAQYLYSILRADTIRMRGMPEAMDIASGVSPAYLKQVNKQAKSSLLGDALNFPMPHLIGALGIQDLGEAFRAPVKTAAPTLLLTGTLDGRTYPEAQRENMRGFSHYRQIIVENAGHNVYMTSPEITPAVIAFLQGKQDIPRRIVAPPPILPAP